MIVLPLFLPCAIYDNMLTLTTCKIVRGPLMVFPRMVLALIVTWRNCHRPKIRIQIASRRSGGDGVYSRYILRGSLLVMADTSMLHFGSYFLYDHFMGLQTLLKCHH